MEGMSTRSTRSAVRKQKQQEAEVPLQETPTRAVVRKRKKPAVPTRAAVRKQRKQEAEVPLRESPTQAAVRKRKKQEVTLQEGHTRATVRKWTRPPKTLREGLRRFLPNGLDVHHNLILAYAARNMASVRDPCIEAELARDASLETVHFWAQEEKWTRAWDTYRSLSSVGHLSTEWNKWMEDGTLPESGQYVEIEGRELLPFQLLSAEAKNTSLRLSIQADFWTDVVPNCPELIWLSPLPIQRWATPMFEAVLRQGELWRFQYLVDHADMHTIIDNYEMWRIVLATCDSPSFRDACLEVLRGVEYTETYMDADTILDWKPEAVRFTLANRGVVPHPLEVTGKVYDRRRGEFIEDLYTRVTPEEVASHYCPGRLLSVLQTSTLLMREINRLAPWIGAGDVYDLLRESQCDEGWERIVPCLVRLCPDDFTVAALQKRAMALSLDTCVLHGLLHQWPETSTHDLAMLANWNSEQTVRFLLDREWQGPVDDVLRARILPELNLAGASLLLESGLLEHKVEPGEDIHWRELLRGALSIGKSPLHTRRQILGALARFLPMHRHDFSLYSFLPVDQSELDLRALWTFLQALPLPSLVQCLLQPLPPSLAPLVAQRLQLPLK